MRRALFFVLLATLFPAARAAAQGEPAVAPGSRVRVYVSTRYNSAEVAAASGYHYGTVSSIDSGSVTLVETNSTEFRIPFSSIRNIDVSRGAAVPGQGRVIGARKGALVGAGIAAGAMGVLYGVTRLGDRVAQSECPFEYLNCGDSDPPGKGIFEPSWANAGKLALIGGAAGALLGSFIGSAGHERWEGVPLRSLRVQLAPAAGGGTAAVSLRF
ncbi:MAG TPA: hypothetical protein VJT67_10345 [Longimicrobiaceae bacterium]|nr:hypothetical protein [Longimicrobiaceae bacterium]